MRLYEVLYEPDVLLGPPLPGRFRESTLEWGRVGKSSRYRYRLTQLLPRMTKHDRRLLLECVRQMSNQVRK
jgi:hypothetical protein